MWRGARYGPLVLAFFVMSYLTVLCITVLFYLDPLHAKHTTQEAHKVDNAGLQEGGLDESRLDSLRKELEEANRERQQLKRTLSESQQQQQSSAASNASSYTAAIYTVLDQPGKYPADWEALTARPLPTWYDDAKLGIFVHWGVYSVPSWADWSKWKYSPGAEWYWNNLGHKEDDGEHVWNFQNRNFPNMYYQDFATQFTAKMWEPEQWAELFAASGAKYVVVTSKHHEGFCMWPSKWAWNWNANDIGPKRDVLGEISKAVRDKGLIFGVYYSLYEWFNPLYLSDKATGSPPKERHYVEQKMLPELVDVVTRYSPWLVWGDGDWEFESDYWQTKRWVRWLYNHSPVRDNVILNDRWGHETRGNRGGYWTPSDGYNPGKVIDRKWENCQTIGESWGYNRKERLSEIKSLEKLLEEFITVVAYGGNYLLNVGPRSDGTIDIIHEERLRDIGKWLKVNGEAIYGTRPWRVQKNAEFDGQHVMYTSKGDDVFAISFTYPVSGKLTLVGPRAKGAAKPACRLLHTNANVDVAVEDGESLVLTLPPLTVSTAVLKPWVFALSGIE